MFNTLIFRILSKHFLSEANPAVHFIHAKARDAVSIRAKKTNTKNMPLYKTINHSLSTTILVWKISESFEVLNAQIRLNEKSASRLNEMKSQMHQRAFLSVRKLLEITGYSDFDLYYDDFGKPHLNDEKHISITHSHNFSAIIVSDKTVGIDIELQRDKIIRIANKFCNSEFQFLNQNVENETNQFIKKLTVIWGAKEAIFKIRNEKGISFKDHINVNNFEMNARQTLARLNFIGLQKYFEIHFEEIQDKEQNFSLVYAFETE